MGKRNVHKCSDVVVIVESQWYDTATPKVLNANDYYLVY